MSDNPLNPEVKVPRSPRSGRALRWTAFAACLCLAFLCGRLLPMPGRETTIPVREYRNHPISALWPRYTLEEAVATAHQIVVGEVVERGSFLSPSTVFVIAEDGMIQVSSDLLPADVERKSQGHYMEPYQLDAYLAEIEGV